MKKLNLLLTAFLMLFMIISLSAQTPPHPNGGSAPGSGSTPVGGGAPVGGGLLILLSLSLGYGSRKVYELRKRTME